MEQLRILSRGFVCYTVCTVSPSTPADTLSCEWENKCLQPFLGLHEGGGGGGGRNGGEMEVKVQKGVKVTD